MGNWGKQIANNQRRCLTKEEVDYLYKISYEKAVRVREQTKEIFEALLKDQHERDWLLRYDQFLLTGRKMRFMGINRKKAETYKKRLWEYGWKVRDPYFLWNFKAITPIVKRVFYDNGVTTYMVKKQYDRMAFNQAVREKYGGITTKFIGVFNDEGERYLKELHRIDLFNKVILSEDTDYKRWRGIPTSIIVDLLGAMRTMGKN